jgi:dihydroorotase-like cyclic amidohydrolase
MEGWNMHLIHNKLSELLSFRRTIEVARATGAAVYFVHTSAREGVEAVAEARAAGLPIYAETLHHYACFSAEQYRTPRGYCYHTYPSLKGPEDQQALWSGLVGDDVSTTATDEFPTSLELKLRGRTVENVTGGNLGAEARMGIMFTEVLANGVCHWLDLPTSPPQMPRRSSACFRRRGLSRSEATPILPSSIHRSRSTSLAMIFTSATTAHGRGGRCLVGR